MVSPFEYRCYKIKLTKEQALLELKKVRRERKKWFGNTNRLEKRAYECDTCGHWHLTSMTDQEHREGLKKKILKWWLRK